MTTRLHHCAASDPGRVRKENEDSWFADEAAGIFIVADGMGGHSGGEEASRLVTSRLPLLVREAELEPAVLQAALQKVNEETVAHGFERFGIDGMGSTVVVLLVRDGRACLGHAGDSRAYAVVNGELTRLTSDDTITQMLIQLGELSENDARLHPARGALTRYVGMVSPPFQASIRSFPVRAGDRFLLCSDGLWDAVPEPELARILTESPLDLAASSLVQLANAHGGKDNITAIVVDVEAAA